MRRALALLLAILALLAIAAPALGTPAPALGPGQVQPLDEVKGLGGGKK